MNKYLVIAIVLLVVILGLTINRMNTITSKYETAVANMKAYDTELSSEKSKNSAYQFKVNQLNYLQDSVIRELNAVREELKIKDKNLKALHNITSVFTKTDTLTMKDTLFISPAVVMDTTLGDKWYSVELGLRYPSTISIKPTFNSSKYIVVSSRKETVNPPKKFFLLRWFQKKHKVIQVNVIEKNPYVKDEGSKYVEIIN